MDHSAHGGSSGGATAANTTAAAGAPFQPIQWPLLAGIAAGTLAVCLAGALLPCGCLRLAATRAQTADADAAAAGTKPEELQARQQRRQRRLATVVSCLTALGAGVILATVFIGLMPAAASAYLQMCGLGDSGAACRAAVGLAPPAGALACCLLLWLARSLVDMARERRGGGGGTSAADEKSPLVDGVLSSGVAPGADSHQEQQHQPAAACCADAATPQSLAQDPTTACLVTSALLLKALVEGLALPSMLRAASPLFVALGKCVHEACCSLVVGLAWAEASGEVRRVGIAALVAYAAAASGSILLGGLTASVQSQAGAGVQFGLLIAASGAGLQAGFVHILPRLTEGPASPVLVLAGTLLMTLVGALHHFLGGGH